VRAPRVSERERFLEAENRALRDRLDRLTANPPEIPFAACDNSCVVARPEGAAPNGGCRCDERKLRHAAMYWRSVAAHRLAVAEMNRRVTYERHFALDEHIAKLESALAKAGVEFLP
jgi:hypothetical protein